jgi:hypothetical protein
VRFGLIMLLAWMACSSVAALEFEVVLSVLTVADRKPLAGVRVEVEADPMWGCTSEAALEAFRARYGPLPEVKASGSGVSGADGRVEVTVRVSWSGEGEMPASGNTDRHGNDVRYRFAQIIVRPVKSGYRAWDTNALLVRRGSARADDHRDTVGLPRVQVSEGRNNSTHVEMVEQCVLKGRVVQLNGREPLADLKLALSLRPGHGANPESMNLETTTDADGRFEFSGPEVVPGYARLSVVGHDHAFVKSSAIWTMDSLRWGTLDVGMLVADRGGAIKARLVDAYDGTPVAGQAAICDGLAPHRFTIWRNAGPDGVLYFDGVPPDVYALDIAGERDSHWRCPQQDIVVKPGELLDLGDIAMERQLELEVVALGGAGILNFDMIAEFTGEPNPRVLLGGGVFGQSYPEGREPPNAGDRRQSEPYSVRARLTAEANRARGLFGGEWTIRVSADGFTDSVQTVTLPHEGPLLVQMHVAGAIEPFFVGANREEQIARNAVALRHGTVEYEAVRGMGRRQFSDWYQRLRMQLPEGMYRANQMGVIADVKPGRYLVIADAHGVLPDRGSALMHAENVEVEPGGTVRVQLTRVTGQLSIRVTRGGAPAAGERVVLLVGSVERASKIELTSNERGIAVYAPERNAAIHVMTELEAAWVLAAGRPSDAARQLESQRRVHAAVGERESVHLELADPDRIAVRLRAETPKRQRVPSAHLQAKNSRAERSRFTGHLVGDEIVFIGVPAGEYSVQMEVRGLRNALGGVSADVTVLAPGMDEANEVSLTLDVSLPMLEVAVRTSDPRVAAVHVTCNHVANESYLRRNVPDWRRLDDSGRVQFDCLGRGGQFRFRVHGYNEDNELIHAVTRVVEVHEDVRVSIELKGNTGALEVAVEAPSEDPRHLFFAGLMAHLKDADGNVVEHDLETLPLRSGVGFRLAGVPAGRYTVAVVGGGLQPWEEPRVEIVDGGTTRFTAKPKRAASLVLDLEGLRHPVQRTISDWPKIEVSYEDADGKPLSLMLPRGSLAWLELYQDGAQLEVLNLSPAVRQVRIKLEGHKEFIVKVEVEDGEIIRRKATIEPED